MKFKMVVELNIDHDTLKALGRIGRNRYGYTGCDYTVAKKMVKGQVASVAHMIYTPADLRAADEVATIRGDLQLERAVGDLGRELLAAERRRAS